MKKILGVKYASPLEREYEAWIVAGIETYLKNVGLKYAIWGIGSQDEHVWPADEALITGSKIVGLQFKRAKLSVTKGGVSKSSLHWLLNSPAHQFGLVKSNPEVYYCLPTFINRDLRTEALHHCLFWRPDESEPDNPNLWYHNDDADEENPYKKIDETMRWGLFLERLMYCDVGLELRQSSDIDALNAKLKSSADLNELRKDLYSRQASDDGTYVLLVERPVEKSTV